LTTAGRAPKKISVHHAGAIEDPCDKAKKELLMTVKNNHIETLQKPCGIFTQTPTCKIDIFFKIMALLNIVIQPIRITE